MLVPATPCLRVPQFGLGGLLQAAEMAWQQNTDIYKAEGYALASAMELHARIINAWDANKKESLLPAGYKFFETSMPLAPQVVLNGKGTTVVYPASYRTALLYGGHS
jgi:hypothetical protein